MPPSERIPAPPPGMYPDVPFHQYRLWDAYNWSALKEVNWSLKRFKAAWDDLAEEEPDSDAREDGHALHAGLARYFRFYNHQRPHSALDNCTPASCHKRE